ncbi:MAG: hypothetical protein JSW11_00240 [Candidatus Heimdallarchaeota archaeon]|nr:MAG: hypothetical protein JSW11_00240 [Candidatus Heimdallarchaeota archaeon]
MALIFGDEYLFLSQSGVGVSYTSIDKLDSSHVIIGYTDFFGIDSGSVIIGNINDFSITTGSPKQIGTSGVSYPCIATINDSQFIVAYKDKIDDYSKIKIGSVNGTDITFGSPFVFTTNVVGEIALTILNSSGFVVIYKDQSDSDHGTAKIGTIDESNITFSSEYEFCNSGAVSHFDLEKIHESGFIIVYRDVVNDSSNVRIGEVSDNTINFGPISPYANGVHLYNRVEMLTPSSCILVYRNPLNKGMAKTGSISGLTITFEEEAIFGQNTSYIDVDISNTYECIVVYKDGDNSNYGTAVRGIISGINITFDSDYIYNTNNSNHNKIQYLDPNKFVVIYRNESGYGSIKVGLNTEGNIFNTELLFAQGFKANIANLTLIINGYIQKPAPSCPILDPTASIQIDNNLINIYQSRIDAVINQLGKNVLLEFDPIRGECLNCEYDTLRRRSTGIYKIGGPISFKRGRPCPYCKGKGLIETTVTKCIKCLIRWNPEDMGNYGISVLQRKGIVRFKTFLSSIPDLIKTRTAISNYDIMNRTILRVKLISGPIPVGLREDRYCISFWEMI